MAEHNKASTSKIVDPFVRVEQKYSYWELLWLIQQILVNAPGEVSRIVASFFIVPPILSSEVTAIRASSFSQSIYPLSAVLDPSISSWWISGSGTMDRGKGKEYIEFQLSSPSSSSSPPPPLPGGRLRRLCKFSIEIPAFPMCPLSVHRLRLEQYVEAERKGHPTRKAIHRTTSSSAAAAITTVAANEPSSSSSSSLGSPSSSGCWKPCSPVWTVENKTGWQEYTLDPPVDVRMVRVVCLTNQIHEILYQDGRKSIPSVPTINSNPHGDSDDDDDHDDEFTDPYRSIWECILLCGILLCQI